MVYSPSPSSSLPLLLILLTFTTTAIIVPFAAAEIHADRFNSDPRAIIPIDEFGFSHGGILDLNISAVEVTPPSPFDPALLGFFLSTLDEWILAYTELQSRSISCPLQSSSIKPVLSFSNLKVSSPGAAAVSFHVSEPGQYALIFANCVPGATVSMSVLSSMYNVGNNGVRSYLSAGEEALPIIYFAFAIGHAVTAGIWLFILIRSRAGLFRIHYLMLLVVVLKTINLLAEAEDKSFVNRTGSAHGWDVLFYIFSFLKGISLFSVIALIGTGWSFLKPFLQDREKRVLIIVIPLQVVANVAQVVIDESGPYDQNWVMWKQVLLLVDVVCCCAVLFPIVWSIKNLREAARTDGKAAVTLMKLTLFRHYYVVVVCYLYFTRVIVYALSRITSYKFLWTSAVAAELATLGFYMFTGYKFRPEVHNPYFVIHDEEEEDAAVAAGSSALEHAFEL